MSLNKQCLDNAKLIKITNDVKRTKKKDPKSFGKLKMIFFYNGYPQYKSTWCYSAYLLFLFMLVLRNVDIIFS